MEATERAADGRRTGGRAPMLLAAAAWAGGLAALWAYLGWIARYTREESVSVGSNTLHLFLWIILLCAVSLAGAWVVRGLHRALRRASGEGGGDEEAEEGDGGGEPRARGGARRRRARAADELRMRMRETRIVLTLYLVVPVALNLFVLDTLCKGSVFSGSGVFSKHAAVATMLRSPDEETVRRGIAESALSTDRSLGRPLAGIVARCGKLSGAAADAAGIRRDEAAAGPLRKLLRKGDARQRVAALWALASLRDFDGIAIAREDLAARREPLRELVIAVGSLPLMDAGPTIAALAGDAAAPVPVRAAAFWAISRIEQERFRQAWLVDGKTYVKASSWRAPARQGWEPLVAALDSPDASLRCGAVQALKYAGPPQASARLTALFDAADRTASCARLAFRYHRYAATELVAPGSLRRFILEALAGIGDRGILPWLEGVAADRGNPDEIVVIARGMAKQIREIK